MTRALAPIVLGLTLGLAAPVAAGTLATPVFYAKDGDFVSCTVANTGTKSVREVFVELVSFDAEPGAVVVTGGVPADLAPLTTDGATWMVNTGFDGYLCRFTFKGSGKTLRAGIVKTDGAFVVLGSQSAH